MAARLPNEIWWLIGESLDDVSDLASLALVNRQICAIVNPLLYQEAAVTEVGLRALFWGIRHKLPGTARKALEACVDPDVLWHSDIHAQDLKELVPTRGDCHHSFDVQETLDWGASTTSKHMYWSPLHLAAYLDDVDMIKLLLEYDAHPSYGCMGLCSCFESQVRSLAFPPMPRFPSWTPYHVAICAGSLSVVDFFLARDDGIDCEMESFDLNPYRKPSRLQPLHIAAMSGNETMLDRLLTSAKAGDVDGHDERAPSPLTYACIHGNWACADRLISHGANINRLQMIKTEPDLDSDSDDDMMDQDLGDYRPITVFAESLRAGRLTHCIEILKRGADPELTAIDTHGMPPVHALCNQEWRPPIPNHVFFERIIKPFDQSHSGAILLDKFLEAGLDFRQTVDHIYQQQSGGIEVVCITALGLAAGYGNVMAVQTLLRAGANADGNPSEDHVSPLAYACIRFGVKSLPDSSAEVIRALVGAGASVNRLRDRHPAPLWQLASSHHPAHEKESRRELANLLLARGANPARGTSTMKVVVGDRSYLDIVLGNREHDEFRALLASLAPGSLGDDDWLGFWDVAVAMDDLDTMKFVIELDEGSVIARKSTAIDDLLFDRPDETDIILRLLQAGAKPAPNSYGHSAIVDIIDYRPSENCPELSDEKKVVLVKALIEAGESIHLVPHSREYALPVPDGELSPLDYVLHGRDRTAKYMELMLELRPPDKGLAHCLVQACKAGNFTGLSLMDAACKHASTCFHECTIVLIHHLLDGVSRASTIRHIYQTVDCLSLLLDWGPSLDMAGQDRGADKRTARDKIRGYMGLDEAATGSHRARGIAWCWSQKMEWAEDGMPVFKPDTMALFFQLHTTLEGLGRMIERNPQQYGM